MEVEKGHLQNLQKDLGCIDNVGNYTVGMDMGKIQSMVLHVSLTILVDGPFSLNTIK